MSTTPYQASLALTFAQCTLAPFSHATIDTTAWAVEPNNCDRYFTDYGGARQCWSSGSTTQRCFGGGTALDQLVPHVKSST